MAELDKKVTKPQTDLVQAVLEAHDKNAERVDLLLINAVKQLKMSRFKPDQTITLSLTYLARVRPQVFQQSAAIKDVLKSLLRRESGPATIKGAKSDIMLPVLAANILLACCESPEINLLVLTKIDQWLAGKGETSEAVQHLLATLCMRCHNDPQTITTLIEMRNYWLPYLEENYETYGTMPPDLFTNIRHLLHTETSCDSVIPYLKFLVEHDPDIDGLCQEISKFILERPLSLRGMLNDPTYGKNLYQNLNQAFIKLLRCLFPDTEAEQPMDVREDEKIQDEVIPCPVKVKTEAPDDKTKQEEGTVKVEKVEVKKKIDENTTAPKNPKAATTPTVQMTSLYYMKLSNSVSTVISMSRRIVEAVFTLLTIPSEVETVRTGSDHLELVGCLSISGDESRSPRIAHIFQDYALTEPANLPDRLRQKLVFSADPTLVELGLRNATIGQLVMLLQQFGTPANSLRDILEQLKSKVGTKDLDVVNGDLRDPLLFGHLMDHYEDSLGVSGARDFRRLLEQTTRS